MKTPMLHVVPQPITVTDHKDRSYQLEAQVALREDGSPVGLAVHAVYDLGPGPITARPDEYTLTHLSSGSRLFVLPVPTEWIAHRWLELVADLTDWTHESGAFDRHETLRLLVALARVQALEEWASDEDLPPLCLPPVPCAFDLDSLTLFLEWIIYDVTLPQQARSALLGLLALHAALAHHRPLHPETAPTRGGRP